MRRSIDWLLLIIGVACLGTYAMFMIQARMTQEQLDESFDYMVNLPPPKAEAGKKRAEPPTLKEGDLVGRLEIPRLDLNVMVLEGVASRTLRVAAGHIPGTAIPGFGGNIGIAAHRDMYFRPLYKIEPNDRIRFRTRDKTIVYRVVSTEIVGPDDVSVLKPTDADTLTLVTCYPFYYIGPAPKRFIVKAALLGEPGEN
jgi:LPXTG-site transpeptidase (sortase) family protein